MTEFAYLCKERHRNDTVESSQGGDLWGLGKNGVERRDEDRLFEYNFVYNCDFCTMCILMFKKFLICCCCHFVFF